jgi:hypothetical protein
MSDTASLKVVKTVLWKGQTRQWSNRYHFGPDTPATQTEWQHLSDAVVAAEKLCLEIHLQIIGTTCYMPGSDLPLFSFTYATNGTYDGTGGQRTPAECAALIRYTTDVRSTKNHPIYLNNYYHAPQAESAALPDTVKANQKTAYETYATAWINGFVADGKTYARRGPRGASALTRLCKPYITHRDFPS